MAIQNDVQYTLCRVVQFMIDERRDVLLATKSRLENCIVGYTVTYGLTDS